MRLTSKGTILIGEDDSEVREYLEMATRSMGYEAILAQDGNEVLSCLQRQEPVHVVLLDIMMPQKDGIETLREIRSWNNSLPVIMVSDASSTINVVNAIKIGATDFLSKPVNHDELRAAIQKAMEFMPKPVVTEEQSEKGTGTGKMFFGTNRQMLEIAQVMKEVAPSDAPVLIRGETGVGKEVIARELHNLSSRSRRAFLKLNCAALPSELIESELFGYERGAFTGAYQKKPGMFELADGGTILLDEIGDMDFKLQAKLLQVLQDQEFQRVGGKETIRVDVRVMAATHQHLERAIAKRQFREDLFYRLNVISIDVPALRNRKEDLIAIAEFLIRKNCANAPPVLTQPLKKAMLEYHWPGNIRELENVMRRYIILRGSEGIIRELRTKTIAAESDEPEFSKSFADTPENGPILAKVTKAKQEAESSAILGALSSTRWNRKQAAVLLRIDYKALLYKMKKLGISDESANCEQVLPPETSGQAMFGD